MSCSELQKRYNKMILTKMLKEYIPVISIILISQYSLTGIEKIEKCNLKVRDISIKSIKLNLFY